MALEYATVLASSLPSVEAVKSSLYEALEQTGNRPVRALQRLHAVLLDEEQASLLHVPPQSPALYIERRSFTGAGEAVEFTSSYYRGDAYDFVVELNLSGATRESGGSRPSSENRS